jgi:ABC-type Mn2+/Zn2+ transport system permease subunit
LLAVAWSIGTLATLLGLLVSYLGDLPTGPLVVCAFAMVLIAAFAVRGLVRRPGTTVESA